MAMRPPSEMTESGDSPYLSDENFIVQEGAVTSSLGISMEQLETPYVAFEPSRIAGRVSRIERQFGEMLDSPVNEVEAEDEDTAVLPDELDHYLDEESLLQDEGLSIDHYLNELESEEETEEIDNIDSPALYEGDSEGVVHLVPPQEESARSLSDRDTRSWILALDRSAIERLPDADRVRRYLTLDWSRIEFPGNGPKTPEVEANWRQADKLFRDMASLTPERRVPQSINYHDVEDAVVDVPGERGHKLHPEASDAFVRTRDAASRDGVELGILSSWRSRRHQEKLRHAQLNPQAVARGASAHMYGLAVDLRMGVAGLRIKEANTRTTEKMANLVRMYRSPVYKWMALHGHEFGWYPYRREPWHWEYNPPGFKERFESSGIVRQLPASDSEAPQDEIQAAVPQELVRFAQRVLNAVEGERLKVDGDLGPRTLGALDRFRKKYSLGAGGVLDDPTQLALAQRALEEIGQQSMFPKYGTLDTTTEEAVTGFKSGRGLGFDADLDPATLKAITYTLEQGKSSPRTPGPVVPPSDFRKLGAGLTPPADPKAYRSFRLTTYFVVDQRDLPTGAVRVPIYDSEGRKLAEGSPEFFAKLSLNGTARLTGGRLINVRGGRDDEKWIAVAHEDYAEVLAYHRRAYAKRDRERHLKGQKATSTQYSGIIVKGDRVVKALRFHKIPQSQSGVGYGIQHKIPLVPFRTLAADIGYINTKAEPKWKGKGGLVPLDTRVYIKEYDGLRLPDETNPGGWFVHDGWFVVNDTGGGIFGAHFDVFVGALALRKRAPVPLPVLGQVWFPGIEQRIPPGYPYGLRR